MDNLKALPKLASELISGDQHCATKSTSGQITPPTTPDGKKTRATDNLDWSSMSGDDHLIWRGHYECAEVIGGGAWSKVYAARDCSDSKQMLIADTPPASPPRQRLSDIVQLPQIDGHRKSEKRACVLAIKIPAHNMAHPILRNEAKIFSFLMRQSGSSAHIIEFYGEDLKTNGLVFARAEKTLSDITNMARKYPSTSLAKTDPITTLPFWMSCAKQLISALSWIHSHNIVHSDIKPANILSTSDDRLVFADFSSSFYLSPTGVYETRPTDAITTQYASPELLKSYSLSRPITDTSPRHPTFASDIWALACTLLVAATGYEPYSFCGHEMRRLAMAKDGSVVASYLNADDWRVGMRVKHGEIVERAVRPALFKLVEKRANCADWAKHVDEIASEADL